MAKASCNGDWVFKHIEILIVSAKDSLTHFSDTVAFQSRDLIQRPGPMGQESIFSSDLESPQLDLIPE